jgi:hypothetical protein
MKKLIIVLGLGALAVSCSSEFPSFGAQSRIEVIITAGEKGSRDARIPISLLQPKPYTVTLRALRPDGSVDTGFNGFVRATVKPGSISSVRGAGASGRNVQLTGGVAENVILDVLGAYGDTRIWIEDIGYVPADPVRQPPPACANGADDDGDNNVDFPADPGCAFANDDSEAEGSFATGTSEILFFQSPRVSDVRGYLGGGTATPFPHEQIQLDTGWRGGKTFLFDVVVTGVTSSGFYVTDLENDLNPKRGYNSLYVFTFSSPARIRACDRLKALSGTMVDFFGYTEMTFPTWLVEEWDPGVPGVRPPARPCLIPEPSLLTPATITDQNQSALFQRESALVRAASEGNIQTRVVAKFGPGDPVGPGYLPEADKTNCDLNRDGKVDFYTDPEKLCNENCEKDPECGEFSNFRSRQNFQLVVEDTATKTKAKIQANGSSRSSFDPVALRGQPIRAFTGVLEYFSGGSQFTIQARCEDDIVVPLDQGPLAADKACVRPRTASDLNETQ